MVGKHARRHEARGGRPLGYISAIAALVGSCTKMFRDKLAMANNDTPYKEAQDDLVACIERRRDSTADGPMDIGNQEIESVWYVPELHGQTTGGSPRAVRKS